MLIALYLRYLYLRALDWRQALKIILGGPIYYRISDNDERGTIVFFPDFGFGGAPLWILLRKISKQHCVKVVESAAGFEEFFIVVEVGGKLFHLHTDDWGGTEMAPDQDNDDFSSFLFSLIKNIPNLAPGDEFSRAMMSPEFNEGAPKIR